LKAKQVHSFELAKKVGEIHLINGKPFILDSVEIKPSLTRTIFKDYVKSFLECQMLLFPGSLSWVKASSLFKDKTFLSDMVVQRDDSGLVHIYKLDTEKKKK